MLQKIRQRLTGWIAGLLLILIGIPFVFWGIGNYEFTTARFVAKVNGEEVNAQDVVRAYQNRLAQFQRIYQGEMPEEMQTQIRQGVLEGFINNELLQQRADASGYRAGKDLVIESIKQIPAFQVGGEFSFESYRAQLAMQGLSEAGFEARQRQFLAVSQLRDGITQSGFATQWEIDRAIRLAKEQREVGYAILNAEDYRDEVKITDEEIESHYEANKKDYVTPETVTLQYIELTLDDVGQEVEVTEEKLRAYYDSVRDRYRSQEERKARHILISVDSERGEEAASAKAQELYERIQNGEDISELAKEYSDDGGTAESGGDLGFTGRGVFVGPFEDALFSMKVGEIRGPIRTEFGFHIIQLDEIKAGSMKSFDEVRDEIEAEYRRNESEGVYYTRAEELADAAFESLYELDTAAERLGLPLKEVPDFTRRGAGPFEGNQDVIDTVFSARVLEDRENSAPIEISDNQVIVLRVAEHQLPAQKTLEQVRDEIRETLVTQASRELAAERGREAAERLRAERDLKKIADEFGADFHEFRQVVRGEPGMAFELLQFVFKAGKPAPGSPVIDGLQLNNGNFAVVEILSLKPGDPALATEAERRNQRRQIARREANEDLTAYVQELRQDAKILVNEDAFQ